MDANSEIESLLDLWAKRTREGLQKEILENHFKDAIIFDVLAPLQYKGTKAYRDSWDAWQPDTVGESVFQIEDLQITSMQDIGFAHGLIRCGGTTPDGKGFEDIVRATFCLCRSPDGWRIMHQHISIPRRLE